MGFKRAFDCKRYDGKTPCDCPCWMQILETNIQTGEERITADCKHIVEPRIWVEILKASNRPAAAVESTRNEIATGLRNVAEALRNEMPRLLSNGRG